MWPIVYQHKPKGALALAAAVLLLGALTGLAAAQAHSEKIDTFWLHGDLWEIWKVPDGRNFFYNQQEEESSWTDPRLKYRERGNGAVSLIVIAISIISFGGLVFGRIYYMKKYFPEAMNPTKKKKDRSARRGNSLNKMSKTKARGKMNQDGKGGRSANS